MRAALFASAATAAAPPFAQWGGAKTWSCDVAVADVDGSKYSFHYQWTQSSLEPLSRYEISSGQGDEQCSDHKGSPCTVVNANDGWKYISYPDQGSCCQCTRNFNAVLADWLALSTGGLKAATYTGRKTINGVEADCWAKAGFSSKDNTYCATTDGTSRPVQFFEHKSGKLKTWDFNLSSYSTGPVPASAFAPPAGCTKRCGSAICRFEAAGTDPQPADLRRAAQRVPRPAYLGASFGDTMRVLNAHVAAAHPLTTPCSSWTLTQLREVQRDLLGLRAPRLQDVYAAASDDARSLRGGGGDQGVLADLAAAAADAATAGMVDVARDAACHDAVMWYVHHLSAGVRADVAARNWTLPLLPTSRPVLAAAGNGEASERLQRHYAAASKCAACHAS